MKKKRVEQLLDFKGKQILVIGDVMLDQYIIGNVSRISPEAPVPVVQLKERSHKLGGAANVALNIKSLGAEVALVGVIGNDSYGEILKKIVIDNNVETYLEEDPLRKTTCKTRVIAQGQHMLRIDEEIEIEISDDLSKSLLQKVKAIHQVKTIDLIIFQDYNKGCLSPFLITELIKWAKEHKIKTALDPKFKNILHYRGIDFFKPNLKELRHFLNKEISAQLNQLELAAKEIQKLLDTDTILVTLSAHGIYIKSNKKGQIIPTSTTEIIDVSGAGDSVLAVCSLLFLTGEATLEEIGRIANYTGAAICNISGVGIITKEQILKNVI